MTRKSVTTGRLPRLDMPATHDHLRNTSPRDLRGANYLRLQDKHRSAPPLTEKVVLLPALESKEEHPLPYYVSGEVTLPALTEVPWKVDEKRQLQVQAETFKRDTRLQNLLLGDLVNDTIREEIVATASIVLEESKYEEDTDRNLVGVAEEVILMPEVQHLVYLTVWSLLYDMGRSLPREEYLKLKEKEEQLVLEPVVKEALTSQVLEGENWTDNLTEKKILSELPWEVLVFHYHRNLQENALHKNVALKHLQERLIIQAAEEEVFKEGLMDALEEDLTHLDELEKMNTPPRRG
ncbi:uncharacterized protein [Panulirus ornatus]|uniref:uncharacterized protein n=1 Tax=Panulirus ornatus TaxID=150431 RepID=UPI003A854BF3